MEFYNSKDEKIDLFDINSIKKVNFIPKSGYEVMYDYSYSLGNLVFICLGIKKTNGVFTSEDDNVGYLDIGVNLGTSFCGLGGTTDWLVDGIGYIFMNSDTVLISDRNSTGTHDRAYINTVCIKK